MAFYRIKTGMDVFLKKNYHAPNFKYNLLPNNDFERLQYKEWNNFDKIQMH